jgi:hypothetical protein
VEPVQNIKRWRPPKPLSEGPWPTPTLVALTVANGGREVRAQLTLFGMGTPWVARTWTIPREGTWAATLDEIAAAVGDAVYARMLVILQREQTLPFTAGPSFAEAAGTDPPE